MRPPRQVALALLQSCLVLACISQRALAQSPDLLPAESETEVVGRHGELPPQAREFDFWLGEWDVNLRIRKDGEWPESTVMARTEIYSILDGKAVLELWDSKPIKGFSLRYFDTSRGKWLLWLNWPGENSSGSSGLSGSFRHGRGDFYSERPGQDGGTVISRYSFNDITPTSLRWDDAFSSDGGETWRHQWRMEFSRTAQRATLPTSGGPAHTQGEGGRCDLPQFRRFEALSGVHEGTVRTISDEGETETAARLVGYPVLGGCATLALLSTERDGRPFESFHQLTWNTYASVFEETVLDSAAESSMAVFFGPDATGILPLMRRPTFGEEVPPERRSWRIEDDRIELEVAVPAQTQGEWLVISTATFQR